MVSDERKDLIEAFRHAVDGEKRFGIRPDCRPELDQRWNRVIDLIVCLKTPANPSP